MIHTCLKYYEAYLSTKWNMAHMKESEACFFLSKEKLSIEAALNHFLSLFFSKSSGSGQCNVI